MADRMLLEVKNVSHRFGDNRVLHNVHLEVAAGQIVSLVGPSGCGKSTLLRAILGTHPPCEGQVLIDGRLVEGPSRHVGIVYQHYALYDFLTARKNVAFGLLLDQTTPAFRLLQFPKWRKLRRLHLAQADRFLAKVGLEGKEGLYPAELSGGMRQRVAVAQALIMEPKILLMDEPFGALDEAIREECQMLLLKLRQDNMAAVARGLLPPHTILIVTHELDEAIHVADRVVGLSQYHPEGDRGATIVYDRPSPVFHPNEPRDFSLFARQKEDLRRIVFEPHRLKQYEEFVTFWKEHQGAGRPGA